MIPKKIFQTHEYAYEELPIHFKATSRSWQILNPDWEYVYHDKNDRDQFVINECPEIYPLYKKVKKMYQADIWRYLIVYKEGGIYADMDSFCVSPMSYILKDFPTSFDIAVTEEDSNNHTNNANFAAIQKSKVLKDSIDSLLSWYKENTDKNIGDAIFTRAGSQIHDVFSRSVYNNKSVCSRTMKASHSSTYKKQFDLNNIQIDFYGKTILYNEILKSIDD
jgi:mannosyltransferase OCH1-like enzyme